MNSLRMLNHLRGNLDNFHKLLACLLLSAVALTAAPTLTETAVYEDSALWPPRAALTADFTSADTAAPRTLPAGREAVLIRLEPGASVRALLDFGRLGLQLVPLAQTDVLDRSEKIASGEIEKDTPNWTMMIGRGFSKLNPGAGQGGTNVPLKDLEGIRHFLIVYLEADPEAMQTTAGLLQQHAETFEAASILPVNFGLGDFPYIGEATYKETLRKNGMEKQLFMAPHVSVPYAKSMAHTIPGTPAIVLVDAEGKTLYQPDGETTSIAAMFTELAAYLKAHPPE